MPITVECACGKSLTVGDGPAGRRVKCPACGGAVEVPGPGRQGIVLPIDTGPAKSPGDRTAAPNLFKPAAAPPVRPGSGELAFLRASLYAVAGLSLFWLVASPFASALFQARGNAEAMARLSLGDHDGYARKMADIERREAGGGDDSRAAWVALAAALAGLASSARGNRP